MNPHPDAAIFCHTAECGYVFGKVPEAKKKKTVGDAHFLKQKEEPLHDT